MADFRQVNTPASAGGAQFQMAPAVDKSQGSAALARGASFGASLFGEREENKAKKDISDAKSQTAIALGDLTSRLSNVEQASETTSGIDKNKAQDLIIRDFLANNKELGVEGMEVFNKATGRKVAELSQEEKARVDMDEEAYKAGAFTDDDSLEVREQKIDLYFKDKFEDNLAAQKIKRINASNAEQAVKDKQIEKEALAGLSAKGATKFEALILDTQSVIDLWKTDPNNVVLKSSSLQQLDTMEREIDRFVSATGKFSQNPTVTSYVTIMKNELNRARDVIELKQDTAAAETIKNRNIAVGEALATMDEDLFPHIIQSRMFNTVVDMVSAQTAGAKFLISGQIGLSLKGLDDAGKPVVPTKKGVEGKKPSQADVTSLDDGEKIAVEKALNAATLPDAEPEVKREAAEVLSSALRHLAENNIYYDPKDVHYLVKLLSNNKATKLLDDEQLSAAQEGYNNYIIDVVDKSVRDNVSNAVLAQYATGQMRRVSPASGKKLEEVADLQVSEGMVYWKLKPGFQGDARAQREVIGLNKTIKTEIVPSIKLAVDLFGGSFEDTAWDTVLPSKFNVETTDEPKKTEVESYGLREDGTEKGSGFFGELPNKSGKVSTELSIGVNFGGEETQIPSLVPTLTGEEVQHLLDNKPPTKEIIDKAVAFAVGRIRSGNSPFWQEGEEVTPSPLGGRNEPKKTDAGDADNGGSGDGKVTGGSEATGGIDSADLWSRLYNAEHASEGTKSERDAVLKKQAEYFENSRSKTVMPYVSSAINSVVNSDVFSGEMEKYGVKPEEMQGLLEDVSKAETNGGLNNQISSGMAGGILQVIPSTFKDLLNRNIVGEKGLTALGKTKDELLSMSNREIAEYLRDNDEAGVIFGMGAYLDKLRVYRKGSK